MEAEAIKTIAMDKAADLDRFLATYISHGRDVQYGHVLVKKIDKSRPRTADGPKGREWIHRDLQVTEYRAVHRDNIPGLYQLHFNNQLMDGGWMYWIQNLKTLVVPEIGIPEFVKLMQDTTFGQQCRDIKMTSYTTTGLRPDLGIKQNPVSGADAMYEVRSNQKESQAPLVQVNTAGSPLQLQTSIANLIVIVFNHRGSPLSWIVVPPASKSALEEKIRAEFAEEIGENGDCSRFVHHLRLWITPERLNLWDIKYFKVVQNAGQLLFFLPGSYFWGWSMGHNVLEMRNHTGVDWASTQMDDGLDYTFNPKMAKASVQSSSSFNPPFERLLSDLVAFTDEDAVENEGGAMINAIPRRVRPKKALSASPFEQAMEMGRGPSSPSAPSGPDRSYPGGSQTSLNTSMPAENYNHTDNSPPAPNFPEALEDQVAYLFQVNKALGQENRDLSAHNQDLRLQNQDLINVNHNLHNQLQQNSSQRELELHTSLQLVSTERDAAEAALLAKDQTIKLLGADLHASNEVRKVWKTASMTGHYRVQQLEKLLREKNIEVPAAEPQQ